MTSGLTGAAPVERSDHASLPALRIDCGVDKFLIKFLIEEDRAFLKRALKLGQEDPAAGEQK